MSVTLRTANEQDIVNVKLLADANRRELGFHARQAFIESVAKQELIVAERDGNIVGSARFHIRRDRIATLYEVVTALNERRTGIGRLLMEAVYRACQDKGARRLRLSCPIELPANAFYAALGMKRPAAYSNPGRQRPLYVWETLVMLPRRLNFAASITASTTDLNQLIKLWETAGGGPRPFDYCIVTPLFADPGALNAIRYMQERWGVRVIFDSGGFFVQQGKIAYEELFARLLEFYQRNDWGDTYVLPDYVPTSRQSVAEVQERVYVTAAEGVKFYRRMPHQLQDRAQGVLQGHTQKHLAHCFHTFMEAGIQRIGFGSFDTGGANSEINLLTDDSLQRLEYVKTLISTYYTSGQGTTVPNLHLFGVSNPKNLEQFPNYLATSFDSSGWLRTAGLGNVYLPFQGRKNVTHGSSSLMSGRGLTAADFYADCERTNHSCPFCQDYTHLQRNRLARIWHNAIVFSEMTDTINSRNAYAFGIPCVQD